MKLFKTTDEKFAEIGFNKIEEDKYGARYIRYNDEFNYTQSLDLMYKESGNHLIQSYDKSSVKPDDFCPCVGLTMYVAKLCIKKMKEMGWKIQKK